MAGPPTVALEGSGIYRDVIDGLSREPKSLPCRLLYDRRGSELFERICELEEYYPTRTETAIMRAAIGEIVSLVGPGCLLVEYGSGSSTKTRVLLDRLPRLAAYMPIDISAELLEECAELLRRQYPGLAVVPLCADFCSLARLPEPPAGCMRTMAYFPGSTIGNFDPAEAVGLMERIASVCGPGGRLLIGVDLKKDPAMLRRAYNDSSGITAAFNKNVLVRLNRELGADFDPEAFEHRAPYVEERGRVEMHLVSRVRQVVTIGEEVFELRAGESIRTECSYKYSVEQFHAMSREAGYEVTGTWLDPRGLFSVHLLRVSGADGPARFNPAR